MFLVLVCHVAAFAQAPGQDPMAPPPPPVTGPVPQAYPPPPPVMQPPPGPGVPYPYQYVPVQLSADDQALLARGEITDGQKIGGVLLNVFLGFGAGQAVQGRYGETGWIFTLGEVASITSLIVGITENIDACPLFGETPCDSNKGSGYIIAGLIGYVGFHVWSIVDAITGPNHHNQRVRELRMRLGIPQPFYTRITPFVNKTHEGSSVAGLSVRF
jgi:hypothetical protein